ncbi:MAG: YlqD family protein [bacterium]
MSTLVKCNVLVKVIMTEDFRQRTLAELEELLEKVKDAQQRIDFQSRIYLADLQKVDLQKAAAFRRQWEEEREEREAFKKDLEERIERLRTIPEGEEFLLTTLEAYVEAKENEPLPIFSPPQIIVKDDKVVEIRR